MVILGYAAAMYALYTWDANPLTGALLGACRVELAWAGLVCIA
jgi:fatty acid desaturase (delta-4 desaturase)